MVTLEHYSLVFRFPEIHEDAVLAIDFQRTLRIPDDDKNYPLPPGLGPFPLAHVDDYAGGVPDSWEAHGGVLLPMYQSEAMWLNFTSRRDYPFAVKVAAGKVNAVTGNQWSEALSDTPQDYVIVPGQPWLDGFCVKKGMVRQFVAMPLGEGYTAEEQLTAGAEHGGLQLIVYPMKLSRYKAILRARGSGPSRLYESTLACASEQAEMGLAPGGLMRQEVYDDPHGLSAWRKRTRSRCFVHILNSLHYLAVTGDEPPTRPPTASEYTRWGLPWFDYYDAELKSLQGARKLASLKSVATKKKRKDPLPDNESVTPTNVQNVSPNGRVVSVGVVVKR